MIQIHWKVLIINQYSNEIIDTNPLYDNKIDNKSENNQLYDNEEFNNDGFNSSNNDTTYQ